MKEDIKILETYLKNSAYKEKDSDFFKDGGWEVVDLEIPQALENLIKGYRELKERNNKNEQLIRAFQSEKAKYVVDYIPKSKIKEKIEELKGYRDLAKEMIEHRVVIADSDSLNFGRAEAHNKDIEVLQELMEEK